MRYILGVILLFLGSSIWSQSADSLVLSLQNRLDTIVSYSANVKLSEDISFIDMPDKQARIQYLKGKPLQIESDDFVLIPKRGLDFSLSELFQYPFITVDRGVEQRGSMNLQVVNLIPEDRKADFSIATLYIDPVLLQVRELEINTRKEGTFIVKMDYLSPDDLMPAQATVSFTLEKLRIPLNFMGKDSSIDRKALRSDQPKEGRILLEISDYRINQ